MTPAHVLERLRHVERVAAEADHLADELLREVRLDVRLRHSRLGTSVEWVARDTMRALGSARSEAQQLAVLIEPAPPAP